MIADGYHDVPAGKLVNVVTFLESRMAPREAFEARDEVTITRTHPSIDAYRETFRRVGAPYLWSSRLAMSDAQLASILSDSAVETYDLVRAGKPEGFLELDFRERREPELAFFGIVRDAQGCGLGRYLMRFALSRAWERPIERIWLHTCTLDDPTAIPFYRLSGFVPYKRQFEVMDDPRLRGLLPRDCAPNVALL